MYKCLKTGCPMYIGEYFGCKLELLNRDDKCNFDRIKNEREKLICKIAKLTTEFNGLYELEEYIKDNQPEDD
ncbi:MAG: hypothetical protein WDA59_04260 [Methanofastidiosum sp.]